MEVNPEITCNVNKQNRVSSSSEDQIDTSDELMEMEVDINECFIADCAQEAKRRKTSFPEQTEQGHVSAAKMICQSEAQKEFIHTTPGKEFGTKLTNVDDNYAMVGAHIDPQICEKIKRGLYVDFAWLLL